MLILPPFFFPTTVLMIDDDKHFLRMLKLSLEEHFHIKTFSDPKELFLYLKEEMPLLTNANKVKDFINSGQSHKIASVIVTDHQLDEITGLEILKKIKTPFIKRILMSNFVDQNNINNAYKNKHIDAYLPKLNHDFINKLKDSIYSLQRQFFKNYCELMYKIPLRQTKLCEQVFANYINRIIKKFAITHMVASDDLSVFEMQSMGEKDKIYLHVAEDQDFEDLISSVQSEEAPEIILDRIRQRISMPCFDDGKISDGSLWAEAMKSVTTLRGVKPYYVSCYTKNEGISLHAN